MIMRLRLLASAMLAILLVAPLAGCGSNAAPTAASEASQATANAGSTESAPPTQPAPSPDSAPPSASVSPSEPIRRTVVEKYEQDGRLYLSVTGPANSLVQVAIPDREVWEAIETGGIVAFDKDWNVVARSTR
ncbi:hypothetical protein [Cohnella fermenti]|uniref:Uncharacterized protein n=1 Tax=Cohnella fermenti TaxID=2565925 RepID=A0A4V3WGG4_9BACL|nr:hypothetical protein [Cohnella fermenti]THF84129.1 hypothetical protein E6C55_02150 [Cohnella fermenti]